MFTIRMPLLLCNGKHLTISPPAQFGFLRRTQDVCAACIRVFLGGGRFAIRTRLVPRPAISIRTMDTSPLVCLYSSVPCVVWRMSCAYCISTNLMKTWRRGPSICIIVTVCSAVRKTSWIQLWISKAEIRRLWWSKLHTRVFLLSSMMSAPTIDQPYYCLQACTVVQHHCKLCYCSLTAHQVKKQPSPLTSASGMDSTQQSQQASGRGPTP